MRIKPIPIHKLIGISSNFEIQTVIREESSNSLKEEEL